MDSEIAERTKRPGVAVGLAWTPTGGDILFVEAKKMKGKGEFKITGQIQDVMRESMQAALSWVRSQRERARDRRGIPFEVRHAHSRAGWSDSEGRSFGGRHDVDGIGLAADG